MNKLVIFGVGLIGGSVALALKKAEYVTHIVGVGRSKKSLQQALDLGVIDSLSDALEANIYAACAQAVTARVNKHKVYKTKLGFE